MHIQLALRTGLVRQPGARLVGLAGRLGRLVPALAAAGDQRIGRSDLPGETRYLRRGADGCELGGCVPLRLNLLRRFLGLLMQLGQHREAGFDLVGQCGQVSEARGRRGLGFRRGVAEVVASLLSEVAPVLGILGALAGALADVFVDAEGEQFDEQALAVGWRRAQEPGKPPCGSSTDWVKCS